MRCLISFVAGLLICLGVGLPVASMWMSPAQAQAPSSPSAPQAVLVIDGSGSMWGELGSSRVPKIEQTQAALREVLTPLAATSRLALLSFGQRRRADCSDVEVALPMDAGPAERVLAVSDKLSPKGKGPLALALREAAKQVPAGTKASIIVVHDGPDNCQQDPCAAAAEIVKDNPAIAIHTLSLAVEKSEMSRVSCIAKAGNGRAFDIQDGAEIAGALAESLKLAGLEAGAAQTAVPDAPGLPGLRLSAAFSDNGAAQTLPFAWRISRADAPTVPILEKRAPEVVLNTAPGSYVVEVSFGVASVKREVTVQDSGPTVARISLEAGTLKLNAHAAKGGPLANPMLTVSKPAEDSGRGEGPKSREAGPILGEVLWIGRDGNAEIVLPEGVYVVRVEDGHASRDTSVMIGAGETQTADLALGTGSLELTASVAAGSPALQDLVFAISVDDPDAPQGRREIARSADPGPRFTLPAGTYYATARAGVAEVRERIAIGTGDTVKHTLAFDVASLAVTVDVAQGAVSPLSDEVITVRVFKADDATREIARGTGRDVSFLLPPQAYRVEVQLGDENVRTEAKVDLAGRRDLRLPLTLNIAELTIAAETPAVRGGLALWRVKDSQGRTVLHSGPGGSSTARLAPGRYVVQSDAGPEGKEQTVELRGGERRTVDLVLR